MEIIQKMNNEEKKKRAAKTTRRQYELYLEELNANKVFRENKFDGTRPNIIEESWENLSHKLNASGGPVKSVQEWKRVHFNNKLIYNLMLINIYYVYLCRYLHIGSPK